MDETLKKSIEHLIHELKVSGHPEIQSLAPQWERLLFEAAVEEQVAQAIAVEETPYYLSSAGRAS